MNLLPVACPACGGFASCSTMNFPDFPAFLFPMAKGLAEKVEVADLELSLCQDCGHIFQAKTDKTLLSRIYCEYYTNYPYDVDEAMTHAYRQPFNQFFDLMLPAHAVGPTAKLLEIGCSRPENMQPFVEKGWTCTGIDPSPLANDANAKSNIRILSGYYEETAAVEPVDVIVSRFNLEHITDLSGHLLKMKHDLKDEGRVIVQVPNVSYYLENRQPLFVAHEHIHYFSQNSLTTLFERFGFTTVACYSAKQPSVLACFEKTTLSCGPGDPVAGLIEGYKANIFSKADDLARHLRGKERVVFYGCGLALYWVLSVLRDRLPPQVTVIDDNPAHAGKALPFHDFTVHLPTTELLDQADLVILTLNPLYHERVMSRLRSHERPLDLLRIGVDRLEPEHLC